MSNYNDQFGANPNRPQPQPAPQPQPQPAPQPQPQPQPQSYEQSGAQPYAQPQYVVAETVVSPADVLYPMTDSDRTLRLLAFIFNLITTVCCAIFILPLAWMIPMTVISYGIYKGKKANTVAFGVCTLLFINLISGILLLVSTKNVK